MPAARAKGGKMALWIGLAIALIAVVFIGWKLFKTGETAQATPAGQTATTQDPAATAAAKKEVQDLVAAVGKLIVLPSEEPTVATVMDAKKLIAEQTFYQGAINGDKLLIYPKAQKAIIYSPSRGVLVNVGPVYFNNDQAQTTAPAAKKATTTTN